MKCQVGIPRVIADVPPRQMNPYLREYISHYFKYETKSISISITINIVNFYGISDLFLINRKNREETACRN